MLKVNDIVITKSSQPNAPSSEALDLAPVASPGVSARQSSGFSPGARRVLEPLCALNRFLNAWWFGDVHEEQFHTEAPTSRSRSKRGC